MIVNCYGHDFFCMFLSDHILIQRRFDLMWCRDRMNIDLRLSLLFWFLFLDLLAVWHTAHHILQIREIDHADIRHLIQIHIIKTSHVHHITHWESCAIHAVERSLHTVMTDGNAVWDPDHFSGYMLRSVTDVADLLVLIILLLITLLCICRGVHHFRTLCFRCI